MKTLYCMLMVMAMVSSSGQAQEDLVVKTYPVLSAEPELLIQALKEVVSERAKIAYFKPGNQILVRATTNEQSLVDALLREINLPAPNVRIDVTFAEESQNSDVGAGVKGAGTVVLTPQGTSYNIKLDPSIRGEATSGSSNAKQTLMTQSGREARLFIGQEIRYSDWIMEFGRQWGYIKQDMKMKQVGSTLVMTPHVTPGSRLINITLTPEISGLVDGKMERIRYSKVATQVTVEDGATIGLGGLSQSSEFFEKFLIGIGKKGEQKSLDIRLTARIVSPSGQPADGGR